MSPARQTDLRDAPETRGQAPGRDRLRGRRVLVVGAGTARVPDAQGAVGNGQAIATLAAREGAAVACVDRDLEAASITAESIRAAGDVAHVLQADVADADACARVVPDATELLGGLDGIVFGVGILGPFGLAAATPEDWDRSFHASVRSHALIATAALEHLDAGSSLVFLGSVSSVLPGIGMPTYDVAKAGVLGLMRHVALEGAPRGVRANAVLPGVVDTPMGTVSAPPGKRERGKVPLPMGRRGTPWDVAHAVVFLLSGEAAYVTGQDLLVDGGLTTLRLGA
jgi:NAD(P)-dependent dehydrogenase (short-subunit alcohol dehydrogenase family)